ncbi:hypothetical protein [Chryseobacterium sp. SC28]|uniref:hypothetical protein n=1 Tax=Chryseobacterium sp. SC28 TaxID=2268028 RepID=UPI000F647B98|nr:hypothetical protein [Chryseobacterium sp. SC28]RRQ47343.1 hypothetical protein DTW91_01285 [Chryseobacterium sp. SC28]
MKFRRKTKKLSGLPAAFYVVALMFFILLFSFNSLYYKTPEKPKPVVITAPKPATEPTKDSVLQPEIYVPDVEVLPSDTVPLAQEIVPVKEEKKTVAKAESAAAENNKTSTKDDKNIASTTDSKGEKITKIGKDRMLTNFIPGTMGKAGKLPAHNCKTKGQLVMFITIDKAGNVTSAGRSSGIKDPCNITAAVIWLKKYVKAKKSQNVSQGTYTIVF